MFLVGLVGFVAASALCGLATTPGTLIGLRIAKGLLGAMLIPQGFGILKATFPPEDLGKAFGAFGPTIGLAVVGAPILGGALIAWDVAGLGWRTIFLINVPLGLAALALAVAVLPESRAEDGPRPDPVGMVLVSTGFALLVFPLVEGRELRWPAWAFGMLAAGVALLGVFARHQVGRSRAGRAPLVEPALFRLRAFSAGMAVGLALFAGMTGLALALGLYLQLGLGYTPLQAGLAQAPWALGIAAGSALSGAVLAARLGRTGLQIGAVVAAAGLGGVLLTVVTSGAAVTGWALAPYLAVCGLGLGLAMTPFFDITLAGVTLPLVGSASGVLNANQQLGGTIGVAVLGTVFFGLFDAGRPTGAMAAVLVASAASVLAAGVLAFLLPRRAR